MTTPPIQPTAEQREAAEELIRKSNYDIFSDVEEGSKFDREMYCLINDLALLLLLQEEKERVIKTLRESIGEGKGHYIETTCEIGEKHEVLLISVQKSSGSPAPHIFVGGKLARRLDKDEHPEFAVYSFPDPDLGNLSIQAFSGEDNLEKLMATSYSGTLTPGLEWERQGRTWWGSVKRWLKEKL